MSNFVDLVMQQNASDFNDLFEKQMEEKVASCLENEKIRIASSLFQNEQMEANEAAK